MLPKSYKHEDRGHTTNLQGVHRILTTKGRRDEGTKGRRDEGTKGRRDEGTKGRRDEGTKGVDIRQTSRPLTESQEYEAGGTYDKFRGQPLVNHLDDPQTLQDEDGGHTTNFPGPQKTVITRRDEGGDR